MNLEKSLSLLDDSMLISKRGLNRIKEARSNLLQDSFYETSSITKQKTSELYISFFNILQKRPNSIEVFSTVEDLIQTCDIVIKEIGDVERKTANHQNNFDELWTVELERNTWKLLYCLYKDRCVDQKDDMDIDSLALYPTEKQIVDQLYTTNSTLREYQLIADWLEECSQDQAIIEFEHYTDRAVAWENSLHQLQNYGVTLFGTNPNIIKSLDPDAPLREKRPLHDLDLSDEARLSKQIFSYIRQGRFDDAQSLCEYCGQPWRAALLEGWRLHHDPNYFEEMANLKKQPIEGNPHRDIWKKYAYMVSEKKELNDYTRGTIAVFCGHLESLLNCLKTSWADLLWGYVKVQIDIKVESEIRSTIMRTFTEMPDKYWNGKMTLEQIFDIIAANKNKQIEAESNNPLNVIQKYLILDNIPELMKHINKWLDEFLDKSPQMLRLLTHVILFLRQINRPHQEDIANRLLKTYVEYLIQISDSQLVAFYTAALPRDLQNSLYSTFLDTVFSTSSRKRSLEDAENNGLDLETITIRTVENALNSLQDEFDQREIQDKMSESEEKKISYLEWLSFKPQQRTELIWQTNSFIRYYLAKRKLNCVRKSFDHVPKDSIQIVYSTYETETDMPHKIDCSVKEYLSYQAYLAAMDSYNDWVHLFHSKPEQPQRTTKSNTNFIEKVAFDHKESAYRSELERWEVNLVSQTKVTKELLYNILLFPDNGWLHDPDNQQKFPDTEVQLWHNRKIQLDNLRKIYIPEIILLLHNVLHLAGEYRECIAIADELVDENRQIYSSIPKNKFGEILEKIAESSLALMNEKSDPWGYNSL